MPRWLVRLEHMSSVIVKGSEIFSKYSHHLSLLDHLWRKSLKNLAGTKWLSLLRKRVCLLWLVYVNNLPCTFHIIIHATSCMYTQVTESLSDMFKSEKQVLDTNATIELNADPFPYELVFNWVYNNYSSVPVSSNCML